MKSVTNRRTLPKLDVSEPSNYEDKIEVTHFHSTEALERSSEEILQ